MKGGGSTKKCVGIAKKCVGLVRMISAEFCTKNGVSQ